MAITILKTERRTTWMKTHHFTDKASQLWAELCFWSNTHHIRTPASRNWLVFWQFLRGLTGRSLSFHCCDPQEKAKQTGFNQSFGISYKFHLPVNILLLQVKSYHCSNPENHLKILGTHLTKDMYQAFNSGLGTQQYSNVSSLMCKLTTEQSLLKLCLGAEDAVQWWKLVWYLQGPELNFQDCKSKTTSM